MGMRTPGFATARAMGALLVVASFGSLEAAHGETAGRVEALRTGGARAGTGGIVHQEGRADDVVAYVLTSARLFDNDGSRRARVLIGLAALDVSPQIFENTLSLRER
jgi:hypothetical protein